MIRAKKNYTLLSFLILLPTLFILGVSQVYGNPTSLNPKIEMRNKYTHARGFNNTKNL